ncbi:MAG: hypothetical protein KY476_20835 [Planctomycetes bacterium]|nr:hypothetical protein [Planctomycetota bacterium]
MKQSIIARKGLWAVGLMLGLGVSVAAFGFSRSTERADCPGKVICPLTGEEVCKDRCPLVDSSRADCPGKVECPLTGELVCRDRCPLDASAERSTSEDELPPCCRSKQ